MNKTVLITGASRGIGCEIARKFYHAGYNVAINYNKSEKEALDLEYRRIQLEYEETKRKLNEAENSLTETKQEREHTRTEFEKAQIELERLAYSRQTEIDPDAYALFL